MTAARPLAAAARLVLLPWLILSATLGITWLVWDHERQSAKAELRSQFDFALRENTSRIEQRMAAYEQMLRGVQGLFATTGAIDGDAFRRYVELLEVDANFSGVQAIGVIERVPAARREAHVAAMRRSAAGYDIRPAGRRDSYAPIVRREPNVGRNRIAPGYDAWTEPVRRLAMEKARDSGMATISDKVRLMVDADTDAPPGFVMYLPIFAKGKPHDNVAQRRANLVGWVFASFHMSDIMASLYGMQPPGLVYSIYDGVEPSAATLFHSSADAGGTHQPVVMTANEYLVVGGHTWTLSMSATAAFEARFARNAAPLIVWTGTGLSLLLALLAWLMATGRARALRLAAAMTSELRGSEQALKAANDALHRQNDAKTRFLAYAGHDLRQPLQAMHLFLSSLLNSPLDKKQEHLARMIDASASALTDLLNSLLDISKLDAGAIRPEPQPIDVDILLAQLIQEFAPQARAKGLKLKLHLPNGMLTVYTDDRLLSSMLRNLIGNAVKYTQRGGVLVAARRRKGVVRIQVWDTGIGISAAEQEHIFEEFYQANNPQRDRTKGLGLGLSIVKRIAALLELDVSCRSRVGRGTVMEIALPLFADDGARPDAAAGRATPKVDLPDLRGRRIVVVEDSLEVAAALVAWLESCGAAVAHYATAEGALEREETFAADFVLSDYRLPGSLTGIDFLDAVRARSGGNVRAALLTGDTSASFIEMAAASSWPILFKPVAPPKLKEILAPLSR